MTAGGCSFFHCALSAQLRLLLTVLVCVAAVRIGPSNAWSGDDAHSLVLLTGIDSNEALRTAFYDGPRGTILSLSLGGYGAVPFGAHTGGEDILEAAVPSPDATESPLYFDGGSGRASLPVGVNLSDEWVVLERPAHPAEGRHSFMASEEEEPSTILHCRLPYPQRPGDVAARESRYIKQFGPRMQEVLAGWLHTAARQRGSGCFFGDGESSLTGVSRFYEVCPREGIYRIMPYSILAAHDVDVQENRDGDGTDDELGSDVEEALHALFANEEADASQDADGDTENGVWVKDTIAKIMRAVQPTRSRHPQTKNTRTPTKADRKLVGDWLAKVHADRQTRQAAHADPALSDVFEMVGAYHERLSTPRWNRDMRVWESLYPTARHCPHHFSETARVTVNGKQGKPGQQESEQREESSPPQPTSISFDDPFWKTVIRFRCPTDASSTVRKRGGRVSSPSPTWAITEVRQLCRYEVEIDAELVCAWEKEFDNLRVNPIPCVALG